MANDTLKAKVELEIDNTNVQKQIDKTSQQLKQKLNNLGKEAGKNAASAVNQTIGKVAGTVERSMEKTSRLLEKGLKFGVGLGSGSILAFLKSGSSEATKFQVKLDNLRGAFASIGQKLATKVDFGGGKTLSGWVDTLANKLNNINTDQLQKIVDIGKAAVAAWAGLKITQGVASGVQAVSGITTGLSSLVGAGAGLLGIKGASAAFRGTQALSRNLTIPNIVRPFPKNFAAGGGINAYQQIVNGLTQTDSMSVYQKISNKLYASIQRREMHLEDMLKVGARNSLLRGTNIAGAGIGAAAISYKLNKSNLTTGLSDIPGIENKVKWVYDVAKQFTTNFYNAFKPLSDFNISGSGLFDFIKNVPNMVKNLYGIGEKPQTTGGKATKEELAQLAQENKLRAQQSMKDKLVEQADTFLKGQREYEKISSSIQEKYSGAVPYSTKMSSLYGRENIMGRISDFDQIIASFDKQLKGAPKELEKTLYSLMDDLKAGRSTLIEKRNDVINSYVEQQQKEKDVREKLGDFTKKRLEIEQDYKDKVNGYKPGKTTLGVDITSIPKLISESLSQTEEDRVKREEDLVEYNKKIAELAEERNKFEKEIQDLYETNNKSIIELLKEIVSNSSPNATTATGIPILAY